MSLLDGFRETGMGLLSFLFVATAVASVPDSVRDWETLWTEVLQKNERRARVVCRSRIMTLLQAECGIEVQ